MKELETEKEHPSANQEPEEDHSRMSFLEHLEDLRKRLINIVYYLLGGFVICWIFNKQIFALINKPIVKVLEALTKLPAQERVVDVTIKNTGQSPLLNQLIQETGGKL